MTADADSRRDGLATPAGQRKLFLDDLAQRLKIIDEIVLTLERTPDRAEDLRRLAAQAHDIKGTGAAFGVPAATDAARDLEQYLRTLTGAADVGRLRRHVDRLRVLVHGDSQPATEGS